MAEIAEEGKAVDTMSDVFCLFMLLVEPDGFRLGACGFLTKPANLMDLREAVQDFARLTVRLAEAPRLPFEDSRRSAA
jgi:hypothetical protein